MSVLVWCITMPLVLLVAAVGPATATGDTTREGLGDPGQDPAGSDGDLVELVVHRGPEAAGSATSLAAHPQATARRSVPQLDAEVVAVPAAAADRVAAQLADAAGVAHVERDGVATTATETADAVIPDDPRWPDQWGLQHIDAPEAWATTTGAADVTVAVLDTGVDPDHPDLAPNLATGRDFTAAGDGGTDTDDHDDPTSGQAGHGTMSAGVLAAVADNGQGVAGTCWECTLVPVRVMEPDGTGSLSRIAEGIVWAVDHGADVINLSLGSWDDVRVMRQAVAYAVEHDVALVSAAGNFGGDAPIYPGAYDAVVSVAASTDDDARAAFSSHGSWVDVAAPGCNPSTRPGGEHTTAPFCGTSSAAPLVSGVVALGLATGSDVTPWQAVQAVTETAEPVGGWVSDGRVDAGAAMAAVAEAEAAAPPPPPGDAGDGDGVAGTDPGVALHRVAGSDRFDTAARVSEATFEPGVSRAYLATGQGFPDALTAGAAAGAFDGPVLLATHDRVPGPTREELARLQPDEVVVVGGTDVLSEPVRTATGEAAGTAARRVAGVDRFATAAETAVDAFPAGAPVAYVATGAGFADALAGVPAAVAEGGPVLLSDGDRLPAATERALAQLGPERIVVLGGTSAVPEPVSDQLAGLAGAGGVQRLAGADRFATAAGVADAVFDAEPATAHLATGADFPDALAGGPAAAAADSPLLLVTREQLPAPTAEALGRLRPEAVVTLGGTAIVSPEVEAAAGDAAAGD